MNQIKQQGCQGDVMFIKRDALPAGYVPTTPLEGNFVVAHSETQHHHVANAADAILYEGADPLVGYLRLESDSVDIVHQRDYHTHATVSLGGGAGAIWEVRRQREYTSEGLRRAAD